jgi:hypothetical protein
MPLCSAAPLDITPEFLQAVPKPLPNSPAPHIAMISLEKRTWVPASNRFVVVESVFKAERPVKAQVVGVVVGEFTVAEQRVMMVDEAVAEGRPGEHVNGYGVGG